MANKEASRIVATQKFMGVRATVEVEEEKLFWSEKIPLKVEGTYLGLVYRNEMAAKTGSGAMPTGPSDRELVHELAQDDSVRCIAVTGIGHYFSTGGIVKLENITDRRHGFLADAHLGGHSNPRYRDYRQCQLEGVSRPLTLSMPLNRLYLAIRMPGLASRPAS